jgi:hypothetical protein
MRTCPARQQTYSDDADSCSRDGSHLAAVALYIAWYNFCRIHMTLWVWVTPAMEAGLADHVWTLKELPAARICLEGY